MFRILGVVAIVSGMLSTPLLAQSLTDCVSMTEDAARLACYDGIAQDTSRTNEHVEALKALREQLVNVRRNNVGSSAFEEIVKRQAEIDAIDRALADERSMVAE